MKLIEMITDVVRPLNIDSIEYDIKSERHFRLTYRLNSGRFSIEFRNGEYEIESYISQFTGSAATQNYELFNSLSITRKEVERIFREIVVNFEDGIDILFREVD